MLLSSPSPIFPWKQYTRFLFLGLLAASLIAGCGTDEPSPPVPSDTSASQSAPSIDSNAADTATNQDETHASPVRVSYKTVLEAAHKTKRFNPKKWLKSDLDFTRRHGIGGISDYDRIIKKMARRYGFDWRLIAAQIYVESNFRNDAQSPVGAQGLMQVMPNTAKFLGYDAGKLILPEVNIAVGCLYDQRMYSLWGRQTNDAANRLAFALASYNAGRGRVLKSYQTDEGRTNWITVYPSLPVETQKYVHKIYLKYDVYRRYVLP